MIDLILWIFSILQAKDTWAWCHSTFRVEKRMLDILYGKFVCRSACTMPFDSEPRNGTGAVAALSWVTSRKLATGPSGSRSMASCGGSATPRALFRPQNSRSRVAEVSLNNLRTRWNGGPGGAWLQHARVTSRHKGSSLALRAAQWRRSISTETPTTRLLTQKFFGHRLLVDRACCGQLGRASGNISRHIAGQRVLKPAQRSRTSSLLILTYLSLR